MISSVRAATPLVTHSQMKPQAPPPAMTTTIHALNRCPHGSPVGACAACMGGGGGGGGSAPKNRAGLMTWNEAFALWQSIQNAKLLHADAQKSSMNKEFRIAMESRLWAAGFLMLNTLNQAVKFISSGLQSLWAFSKSSIARLATPLTSALGKGAGLIAKTTQQIINRFVDVSDKLAVIFGEQQKLLRELLTKNLERLRKLAFLFEIAQRLSFIGEIRKKAAQLFHSSNLKKRISKVFGIFKRFVRKWPPQSNAEWGTEVLS